MCSLPKAHGHNWQPSRSSTSTTAVWPNETVEVPEPTNRNVIIVEREKGKNNDDEKKKLWMGVTEPLSKHEVTQLHHLLSVATDWTLLLDRKLAANCRNISDEVFPGIHLGDRGAAKNAFYLKKIGVTHVLNTAEGQRVGLVDTNQLFYSPHGIKYKGLKLLDVAQTNIAMHFAEVAEYIDEALVGGGQVLVNCLMGMSRSSTCVLAYLMICQNMTAIDALTAVRRRREVRPNNGFLLQLAELDNNLRRERGQLETVPAQ